MMWFFFAYDWRKSCINSAKELASLSSDYDKTIMISHSMGGLVTSYMLAKYSTEASKIE